MDRFGYAVVDIYDGRGKFRRRRVHRMVLLAHVGLPKNGEECRHLNDVKLDNRAQNLAWGTRSENVIDSYKNNPGLREKLSSAQRERRRRENT